MTNEKKPYTQNEKEHLIGEAAKAGIALEICQFVSLDRQHSLWYGGVVAVARKRNLRLDFAARGDVCAELFFKGQDVSIVDVNDKRNDGMFLEGIGKYIKNDTVLEQLLVEQEWNGLVLNITNNNWFEFEAYDEEKQQWIGPDALDNICDEDKLLDILTAENLISIFDYIEKYEEER